MAKWTHRRSRLTGLTREFRHGKLRYRIFGEWRGPLRARRFYYILEILVDRHWTASGSFERLYEAKAYAESDARWR